MANLAGWPYWKVVSITGQAGAGTDYQVELEIGDSAGGDFHLEGHCTNFPQDIRITDDDGTTLSDHFVLDLTADPITVKIEVKDDLGSNRDIRVYYGKSGETTASNGANTFIQYNGQTATGFNLAYVQAPPLISEARITQTATQTYNSFGVINTGWIPTDDAAYFSMKGNFNIFYSTTYNENVYTQNNNAGTYSTDAIYEIVLDGTDVKFYRDNILIDTITTNVPDETMGMFYRQTTGDLKWAFIRKYNSPEPAFSSAGAEQTPGGVAPTSVFYGPLVGPFGGPI